MIVVVMGVSGSGKTLIGTMLAARMQAVFADADDYHSPENKRKMAAGIPLTDEDRAPWLQELHSLIKSWQTDGASGVLACSALKGSYRETLSKDVVSTDLRFVWLDASPEVIAARLAQRQHEYMNASLLPSQLAALEPPSDALHIVNDHAPESVVDEISRGLHL